MKTVAFNMSHDASICTCENGKIETYLEEERVSRLKQDSVPVNAFYKSVSYTHLTLPTKA